MIRPSMNWSGFFAFNAYIVLLIYYIINDEYFILDADLKMNSDCTMVCLMFVIHFEVLLFTSWQLSTGMLII